MSSKHCCCSLQQWAKTIAIIDIGLGATAVLTCLAILIVDTFHVPLSKFLFGSPELYDSSFTDMKNLTMLFTDQAAIMFDEIGMFTFTMQVCSLISLFSLCFAIILLQGACKKNEEYCLVWLYSSSALLALETFILLLDFLNGKFSVGVTGSIILFYRAYTIYIVYNFRIELIVVSVYGPNAINFEETGTSMATVKYTA